MLWADRKLSPERLSWIGDRHPRLTQLKFRTAGLLKSSIRTWRRLTWGKSRLPPNRIMLSSLLGIQKGQSRSSDRSWRGLKLRGQTTPTDWTRLRRPWNVSLSSWEKQRRGLEKLSTKAAADVVKKAPVLCTQDSQTDRTETAPVASVKKSKFISEQQHLQSSFGSAEQINFTSDHTEEVEESTQVGFPQELRFPQH